MRSSGVLCLFSFLILFTLLKTGSCYQCYLCAGLSGAYPGDIRLSLPAGIPFSSACATVNDTSKLEKIECPGEKTACLKTVSPVTGKVILTVRECGNPFHCKMFPYNECYQCTTQLCNSAVNVFPSLLVFSVVELVIFKLL